MSDPELFRAELAGLVGGLFCYTLGLTRWVAEKIESILGWKGSTPRSTR